MNLGRIGHNYVVNPITIIIYYYLSLAQEIFSVIRVLFLSFSLLPSQVERILRELEDEYRSAVLARLASLGYDPPPPGIDPLDLPLADFALDLDSSDGGSDSSISDGLPVHLLAKEARKKRKKKLKSRRERNKKKALLKMTHAVSKAVAPPTQPPMMSSAFITQQSQPTVVSYHPHHNNGPGGHAPLVLTNQRSVGEFSYIPNEVARNGGIPVFIQERLDERQKRRSDIDSGADEVCTMELKVMYMT